MNRPSDDDYDERGAMRRMLESEAALPVQPPPAIVISDRPGKWFYAWCSVHQRRLGPGETQDKAAATSWAAFHNEDEHGGAM